MPIVFGKYQLQRKLAEGGMAEVFLGRQAGMEGFEKLIVLKRIRPELSQDPSFVNMFLNEARVAARLNHPNIVQIFELGKVETQYFIAMEFINGEDLRTLTRQADGDRKHPTPGLVCRIIADTLAGLHYAHTRSSPDGKPLGLVHRDVSPQNVLVTYEGGVKLVDFGIAKATRGGALTEQTRAGLFKGKFAYMSPEQSRGAPLDARSDVFAVGILLWELLTWTRLFKRANDMATLLAVAEEEIPSPRSFDAKIPVELERIVMKALSRKTHLRYTTAQEMRAELEALIRTQGWEADSLALQQYMCDLFADKLRRQEEDIRESGFGSLEDFLLTVDEKSSISWIKSVGVKTPSSGLPAKPAPLPGMGRASAVAFAHTAEHDLPADSGGLAFDEEPAELPGEATSFSPMPVFDEDHLAHSDTAAHAAVKIDPHALATAHTAPVAEVPPLPPREQKPLFGTQRPVEAAARVEAPLAPQPTAVPQPAPAPAELPSLPTAIVSQPGDLPSLPTAIVAPALERPAHERPTIQPWAQPAPQPSPARPPTVELSPAVFGAPQPSASATLPPRGAWEVPTMVPPSRPAESFDAVSTTAPRPAFDPPPRRRWPWIAGAVAVAAVAGLALTLLRAPGAPIATLDITLDTPAIVAIDGHAEPLSQRATVQVKPGVAHVVTVEREGKIVRTLNVPGMAPNEQLQLNVIVR